MERDPCNKTHHESPSNQRNNSVKIMYCLIMQKYEIHSHKILIIEPNKRKKIHEYIPFTLPMEWLKKQQIWR